MGKVNKRLGVISSGIQTPIIRQGDDLIKIVINSVSAFNGGDFHDGDVIAVTEAVVAIAQGNFATYQNISTDIANKFKGAKQLVVVDPIQSRNRFMDVLKAIASTPTLEKIHICMTWPADEVGNPLITDSMAVAKSGINPYTAILTVEEFYKAFGEPKHPFTGKNYIEEYLNACNGKANIILCNNFAKVKEATGCNEFLIASIHRRNQTRKYLEEAGANRIYDLSEIMNTSINGSGYSPEYGVYGSNLMNGGKLKLMPRNGDVFVNEVQRVIYERFGKKVEVMIFGDGAFKDPVGGIWELADPTTTIAATDGLEGTPEEVKLKYIASACEGMTAEEIEAVVVSESAKRKQSNSIDNQASLGTTPRRIVDLLASLSDLTTGSGDRQTPVVYIQNYLT